MKIIRGNTLRINLFRKPTVFEELPSDDLSRIDFDRVSKTVLGCRLYPSKYNLSRAFADGSYIIYNTLHDSVVLLDTGERQIYEDISARSSYGEFEIHLFALGILKRDIDDEVHILKLLSEAQFQNKTGNPAITILPTQACNARCLYCFAEHNSKITMSPKTVESVLNFLAENFSAGDKITFRWFGGEPLLAERIIDDIIKGTNQAFDSQLHFESVIFTNGSLLSDELMHKMKESWRVKKVQLTIDDYGDGHKIRKGYANSDINYYEKVIADTAKLLFYNIAVDCRVNLDKDNICRIDNILHDLLPFRDNPLFRVRLTILRPSDCCKDKFNYIKPDDLAHVYGIIYNKLFSYGFIKDIRAILPKRRREGCIAYSINKVIIGADGCLYKCLQEVLNDDCSVGNLQTGIIMGGNFATYSNRVLRDVCTDCQYLPICMGGCEYYWRQGTADITPCIREKYFMNMLLNYVHDWTLKR